MADPTAYTISYSFTGFQNDDPDSPLPAQYVDGELQDIQTAIASLRSAVMDIRRSDGTIRNGVVTVESLSPGLLTGIEQPTDWATATAYAVDDTVFEGPKFYIALEDHTSDDFATDLAAGKWRELTDFTPSGVIAAENVVYDGSGSGLAAETVQAAVDEVKAELDDHAATAVALANLGADVLIKLLPVGLGPLAYSGTTEPSGWLFCYGQEISRTTYAALFAAIGTTHGVGDGSTTFNLPDKRGRVGAGKDNMGGTSANRLTNLSGGVDGDTLGATGGLETHVLTTGQMPAHTHAGTTESNGAHTHTVSFSLGFNNGGGGGNGYFALPADDVTGSSGAHTHTVTIDSAGGGTAHNNVQPTIVLNYIIFAGVAVA